MTHLQPARALWAHESQSPKTGRKIDQEWNGGPGKIYGNGISSFVQKTQKFEPMAKAYVFVINTLDKVDKCHCMSAQMDESGIPYSSSRLIGAIPTTMEKDCHGLPKLKELAHRPGTRS